MQKIYAFKVFIRHFLFSCLLLVAAQQANAQTTGTVRGLVSDNMGTLPGATVAVKGSTNGSIADVNGRYSLRLEPGTYTIVASFIGYTSKEIGEVKVTAGAETVVDLQLGTGAGNQLQEVTVSYGRQRRKEITGSVATQDAAPLQDMPVQQFAQQLQGKIAGVSVVQSSGQPGRGVDFRIRGSASFYSDNQPLFVVDGLPITGSINNINPSEIESFSVLKDASATALYGSRAANGVILITTRHGKAGDSKIEFNANYGLQKIPGNRVSKVMNGQQFAEFMRGRAEDATLYEPGYKPAADFKAAYLDVDPSTYGEGTNWFKLLTRTAPIQNYDVIVQSATEKSSSTAVFGYQEQQGAHKYRYALVHRPHQ